VASLPLEVIHIAPIRTGALKISRTQPAMIRKDARYDAMNAECRICFRGIIANPSGLI
jgi:hypothetical protein